MAHKKGASSTRNGRDSNAQRLGIGAPVAEIIRKIIRIQKDVPKTKQPAPKEQPKTSKEQQ